MTEALGAHWLALRESADRAARDPWLVRRLQHWRSGRHDTLRVLELGCGIGAHVRFLALRLGGAQHWWLWERDPVLLAALPATMAAWARHAGLGWWERDGALLAAGAQLDLVLWPERRDLAALQAEDLEGIDLLTGSALLHQVSAPWLEQLADACQDAGCAVYFTLSVDGRIAWRPPLAGDAQVRILCNRHQRSDKGLGPALGPAAAATLERLLTARGYRVWSATADWRLGAADAELQRALLRGYGEAVAELRPGVWLERWWARHETQLARGRSGLRVGHRDLLALPG
ncbi:MAG TPA: class I SAM-dependent methyltransferase [Candidatus Competibacteraceae bacterium]|nr:class I SAM-dependent methyltransferase [Candidatus Competibacteraceae bacterium]